MPLYNVYATVEVEILVGKVKARTEALAIQKIRETVDEFPTVCHHCNDFVDNSAEFDHTVKLYAVEER